jgi:hypothetical protein
VTYLVKDKYKTLRANRPMLLAKMNMLASMCRRRAAATATFNAFTVLGSLEEVAAQSHSRPYSAVFLTLNAKDLRAGHFLPSLIDALGNSLPTIVVMTDGISDDSFVITNGNIDETSIVHFGITFIAWQVSAEWMLLGNQTTTCKWSFTKRV